MMCRGLKYFKSETLVTPHFERETTPNPGGGGGNNILWPFHAKRRLQVLQRIISEVHIEMIINFYWIWGKITFNKITVIVFLKVL